MGLLTGVIVPPWAKWVAVALLTAAIIGGLYYWGYHNGTAEGKLQVAQFKSKADDLQIALDKEKTNIKERVVTQYVDKIVTVEKHRTVYVQQATQVVPAQHELSNGWVYLYNSSALGKDADQTLAADPTSSGVMDNTGLVTIVDNNSSCRANIAQIESMQSYLVQLKATIIKLNAAIAGSKK